MRRRAGVCGTSLVLAVVAALIAGPAAAEPPRNDDFDQREGLWLPGGTLRGTNVDATKEPGEPNHAGNGGGASVWFNWGPLPGVLTLDTRGSDFDTVLGVYLGAALRDLRAVAANDDSAADGTSRLSFHADPGASYSIALDGKNGRRGSWDLHWRFRADPPPNDDFARRLRLTQERGFIHGRTWGATREPGEPTHAGTGGGQSVWYRWTAPKSGRAVFDTFRRPELVSWDVTDFDSVLAVYRGNAVGSLDKIAANDDHGDPYWSRTAFPVRRGQTFAIAVDGHDGARGNFILSWNVAPRNDDYSRPSVLKDASGRVAGTTFDATYEIFDAYGPELRDEMGNVWYRWTPTDSGRYVFRVTATGAPNYAPVAYTGAEARTRTPVARTSTSGLTTASTEFQATAGTTYRVEVATDYWGPFELDWRRASGSSPDGPVAPVSRPANDNFASAKLIGGREGLDVATTFNATRQAGEPNHAGRGGRHSLWYSFRASASGVVIFSTEDVGFDSVLAAYRGSSLSALTQIAADDDSGTGGGSVMSFPVDAGERFMVAVDGAGRSRGRFVLRWRVPPPNDDFADATRIAGEAGTVRGTTEGASVESGEDPSGLHYRTIWYRWTAPTSGTYEFDPAGSEVEAELTIGRGTTIEMFARAVSRQLGATAGLEYQIQVTATSTFGVPAGPVTLNWRRLDDAPANDNRAAARTLVGAVGVASGTNVGSSREAGEPEHGRNGRTVWFRFTAPSDGTLHVHTIGSTMDSSIVAYTGATVDALTKVDGNYITTGGNGDEPTWSYVSFFARAGSSYWIVHDGVAEGSYSVTWTFDTTSPDSRTSNDDFADAHVLTGSGGNVWASNVGATKEAGEPNHAGNRGGASIWYAWRAPVSGTTFFQTTLCSPDTLLAVYTGSRVDALSAVASNDDYTRNCGASFLRFEATAGVLYHIAVDGKNGATGDIRLQWTPPAADATPPDTRMDVNPRGFVAQTSATFEFWSTEEPATFLCSLDGSAFAPCTSPRTYTGLAPGTHTFAARATDTAGNVDTTPVERTWRIVPPPPNDAVAAAQPLVGEQGTVQGTLKGATREANEPQHTQRPSSASVWYRLTPTRSGIATVAVYRSTYESLVDVYTGSSAGSLTRARVVVKDQDGWHLESASFRVNAGTTYRIVVAGVSAMDFRLAWRVARQNDDLRNAAPLTGSGGRWTGDNVGASREPGEPTHHGGSSAASSIWFRWTAPASGMLTVDTVGTDFDAVLGAYTRLPLVPWHRLYERAADDSSAGSNQARVRLHVFKGTTYFFAVDGWRGAEGPVALNWRLATPAPISGRPSIRLTAPEDGTLVSRWVTLGAAATDPDGVESVHFLVNGSLMEEDDAEPFTIQIDSRDLRDGTATIVARAFDFSSSWTDSAPRTIRVDNTRPTITITNRPTEWTTSTRAEFSFRADEPGVAFECFLDTFPWRPCTPPVVYEGLAAGEHVFVVAATDLAGNEANQVSWRWVIGSSGE